MLKADVNEQSVDWVDSTIKGTAVVINCCLEPVALNFISERGIVELCDSTIKLCKWTEATHQTLIGRCMNIIAKVAKNESACAEIMNSKSLLITCMLYYGSQENEDLGK